MIKVKTDLEFGDVFYLKNDTEQLEHLLVGVIFLPGNQIKFLLSYLGEVCEVWDFEASKDRDDSKVLNFEPKED
jgi:hypothetical protein